MAPPLTSLYTVSFALAVLVTLLVGASLRLLAILPNSRRPRQGQLRTRPTSARILVVLGSGGHTHEMFALLRNLDTHKYTHRTYVVSSGDAFSAQRAVRFEEALEKSVAGKTTGHGEKRLEKSVSGNTTGHEEKRRHCVGPECYTVATIPRARRVHQPLYTTPVSALRAFVASFQPLLLAPAAAASSSSSSGKPELPNLIITNGPATAVMLIVAALVLRFFNIRGVESKGLCRTVYVESFARVKTLSLSGRLLVRVVDRFLVQWEELEGYGGRAEYKGILV